MAEDAGLISAQVAARLLTLTPEEFRKLDRAGWFEHAGKDSFRIVDVVQGHIRWLKKQADQTGCTVAQAANHIGVTQRWFFELLDKGIIKRHGREGYSLSEVRGEYMRHLRDVAAGHGDGRIDLPVERALLARQQTESMALRNAIARSEYVSVVEVRRQLETCFGVIRERLLSIPGKISNALANRSREEIEPILAGEVNEALDELYEPSEVARRAAGFSSEHFDRDESIQAAAQPQPN
jgi:phage terminase Nu1 subunit (DNA packaging protein)